MAQASIKPIAFIVNDVPLSSSSYLLETLNEYFPTRYLICHEHPPGGYSHYHFLVDFTEKQYNTYIKRIREKFNLRGKAIRGLRKQYGRIRNIEDIEKLKSYMLKDHTQGHYWCENYTEQDIQKYIDASYKKDAQSELCFKVNNWVKENWSRIHKTYGVIECNSDNGNTICRWQETESHCNQYYHACIEYHLINKIRINKTTIKNYYTEFLRLRYEDDDGFELETSVKQIFNHIFRN